MSQQPQLHSSRLGTKCMVQMEFRDVRGISIPPGVAAAVGSGTDESVTANLEHKMKTGGGLLDIEEVEQIARDGVNRIWEKQGVRLTEEEVQVGAKKIRGQAVDKAVRLAKLHRKVLAPRINPTAVQRPFTIDLRGYNASLVGKIDIQEFDILRDTKTTGRTPSPEVIERSLQMKAYSTAVEAIDGTLPAITALDFLVDGTKPKNLTLTRVPHDGDTKLVLARVEIILRAFESGIFPPVEPDHWCCDPKWCGYTPICPYYTKRPYSVAVGA